MIWRQVPENALILNGDVIPLDEILARSDVFVYRDRSVGHPQPVREPPRASIKPPPGGVHGRAFRFSGRPERQSPGA